MKKEIKKKDHEIQIINDEIVLVEKKLDSGIFILIRKNDVIENELKEIRIENQKYKLQFELMEKEIKTLKVKVMIEEQVEIDLIEREVEAADTDTNSELQISCEKCECVVKSEACLKTHNTVKHKKSMMRE